MSYANLVLWYKRTVNLVLIGKKTNPICFSQVKKLLECFNTLYLFYYAQSGVRKKNKAKMLLNTLQLAPRTISADQVPRRCPCWCFCRFCTRLLINDFVDDALMLHDFVDRALTILYAWTTSVVAAAGSSSLQLFQAAARFQAIRSTFQ